MIGWLSGLFGGKPRSGSWRRVRAEHLAKNPACIACGRTSDMEVHHVVPFHDDPSKELDPENIVSVCADPCHFVFGHCLDWRASNPFVREDAAAFRSRREECRRKDVYGVPLPDDPRV